MKHQQALQKILPAILIFSVLIVKLGSGNSLCSVDKKKSVKTFEEYKKCFEHSFHPNDENYRRSVFEENLQTINKLRTTHKKTEFHVNEFAHLTLEEFKSKYLGYTSTGNRKPIYKESNRNIEPVDWREKGVVTKIENQGQCGSCYAFSAVCAIESHHAIKTTKLVTLSKQQVVDCSRDYENHGCYGGMMNKVFNYSKDFGLMSEEQYPYVEKEEDCKYEASRVEVHTTGWTDLESGNEDDLTKTLRTIGPVSVAIDGSQSSFMFYSGGVYDDSDCSSYHLTHGVIAVGVTDEYYIVKNSWGTTWGERGYVRIARNHQNRCGIATEASYPNVS